MKRIHPVKDKYIWYFDKAYKFVSYETARLIIKNKTLRFSNPDTFNDPFDCTEYFFSDDLDSIRKLSYKEKLNFITSFLFVFRDKIEQSYIDKIDHILRNIDEIDHAKMEWEKLDDSLVSLSNMIKCTLTDGEKSNYYISCFSENYKTVKSGLMWAHYAQKHSGVSICFDYSKYDAEELVHLAEEYSYLLPFRVKYITKFDKIRLNKNRIYSDWLLTKSNIWSYEKEVRMIMENGKVFDKHLDLPFPKKLLSKIIFGANTSQNVKKEIIKLAVQEFYTIEFEEMYIDFDLKIKSRKISIDKFL